MIVISLALVIAAAVSLFIGLFVVTDSLTFIFIAIALCLLSLLLLWLGTRTRKASGPSSPSAPVYGAGARAGGSTTPARAPERRDEDDLDELTSPDGGAVVRKTTARDRAASRASASDGAAESSAGHAPPVEETPTGLIGAVAGDGTEAQTTDTDADALDVTPAEEREPSAAAATPTPKKATAKKATAKKAGTKKATAKRAGTKKATKKAAATQAPAASTSGGTTGADARSRLAQISGVGPAKQDALLSHFGSLEGIRDASVDDIVSNVKGFGQALATRVKDELS